MENRKCVVTEAVQWVSPAIPQSEGPHRETLGRILRLLVEIREGKGLVEHMAALRALAGALNGHERSSLGDALLSLVDEREDEFLAHIQYRRCPVGTCFAYQPAPCHAACPAHIDIPSFIALIGQGRHEEATEVILNDIPFPWTCGLICPHPCEDACLRGEMDQPISIQLMKAYAARMTMARRGYGKPPVAEKRPEKVAIIGGGPSGLSAAYFLVLKGYRVTVFEKLPFAGGMLRFGIPAYRLPREILDGEVKAMIDLGVEIKTNVTFGKEITLESLRQEGFRAFYLATGLSLSHRLNVPGEDLTGVWGGIDLLRMTVMGTPPRLGNRVIVIGGGNVAVDVARTAKRLGGRDVTMVCLETAEEMPAWKHEIHEAMAEGIMVQHSWGPRHLMGKDGMFRAVEFMKCTSVFDENRIFSPRYDDCQLTVMEADNIILAIGQAADSSFARQENLDLGPGGTIRADPVTGETDLPGVFAGGDGVYGPRIAIDAIAAGKRAAVSIDCHLTGKEIPRPPYVPTARGEVDFLPLTAAEKVSLKRSPDVMLPLEERAGNFRQVEMGLTDEMALNEAKRCLRCDRCRGDGLCQFVCSELGVHALQLNQTSAERLAYFDFARTHEKCIGCGGCEVACPYGNITMKDENGTRKISFCGTQTVEFLLEKCQACGTPFATERFLDLIRKRSDEPLGIPMERNLCPACARRIGAERMAGKILAF